MQQRTFFRIIVMGALVAVLAAPAAYPAGAQPNTANATSAFKKIDTDGDGKLDRKELTVAAGLDFDKLDVDHDGSLTLAELQKTHDRGLLLPFPKHLDTATAFAAVDTDRDHKIDKTEYETAVVNAYMSCDRNHDGTIELSDLKHCSL